MGSRRRDFAVFNDSANIGAMDRLTAALSSIFDAEIATVLMDNPHWKKPLRRVSREVRTNGLPEEAARVIRDLLSPNIHSYSLCFDLSELDVPDHVRSTLGIWRKYTMWTISIHIDDPRDAIAEIAKDYDVRIMNHAKHINQIRAQIERIKKAREANRCTMERKLYLPSLKRLLDSETHLSELDDKDLAENVMSFLVRLKDPGHENAHRKTHLVPQGATRHRAAKK